MKISKGFLYRRLARYITCTLKFNEEKNIALASKHHISSFQDVILNPFYWECLLLINVAPNKIIDLGANFGYFTVLANQVLSYKWPTNIFYYHLIEANQNLIKPLKKSLNDAGIETYKIHNGLAGPRENQFFMNNSQNLMASKIDTEGSLTSYIDFNQITFEKPDLIKIDIEGAEFELFENFFEWISTAQNIIIEFHETTNRFKAVNYQLLNAGFQNVIERRESSGYLNCMYIK